MKKVLYGTYYKPEGGESQTENGNIPQIFRNRRQKRRPERAEIIVRTVGPVGLVRQKVQKNVSPDSLTEVPGRLGIFTDMKLPQQEVDIPVVKLADITFVGKLRLFSQQ